LALGFIELLQQISGLVVLIRNSVGVFEVEIVAACLDFIRGYCTLNL
jgi:hypothetical protein